MSVPKENKLRWISLIRLAPQKLKQKVQIALYHPLVSNEYLTVHRIFHRLIMMEIVVPLKFRIFGLKFQLNQMLILTKAVQPAVNAFG